MSRINMFNMSAALLSCFVGVWTGVRFFEPIIVERLRQDGSLRQDMQFPEYDDEGEIILPEGVEKPDIMKMLSGEQKLEQTTLAPDLQQRLTQKQREEALPKKE